MVGAEDTAPRPVTSLATCQVEAVSEEDRLESRAFVVPTERTRKVTPS